ncbi:MAG: hypothetical protein ACH350_02975 [Parachlamydiaceae bacterium]
MHTFPFKSQDHLKEFINHCTDSEFQEVLPSFSPSHLANSLALLQSSIPQLRGKLHLLFQCAPSSFCLEGQYFTPCGFIEFLNFMLNTSSTHNLLNQILIQLPPPIFSSSLRLLKEHHLQLMREEALLEPLHYQLTQFIHEGEALRMETQKEAHDFKQHLLLMQIKELTHDDLDAAYRKIDDLKTAVTDYLESAKTALAIVWHTHRLDLIDKLSCMNESLQHDLMEIIGHPASEKDDATGLYLKTEEIMGSIFDSSLMDDDASVEGMTRLDIWHLKDYWELGLLPSIHHSEGLELDSRHFHEKDRWRHQQNLISLIQDELENLGIGKVRDLKKHHVYSKQLLKWYLNAQRFKN